ncbi:hypothetical protein J6590_076836 [Homalodisca vitripennis]|nr:hypothetical protein J6590_076836 [Homalodisca vitripennis]
MELSRFHNCLRSRVTDFFERQVLLNKLPTTKQKVNKDEIRVVHKMGLLDLKALMYFRHRKLIVTSQPVHSARFLGNADCNVPIQDGNGKDRELTYWVKSTEWGE